MKTEVCCLPRVSEPVAIFRRFFIPVCKFRGTEWEPVLHTACERGWRTSCAGVCTGSSEQLFPVCKGSFPTWQHQFPAEIWWAGLGFSCNAHEFTSVGKLEQLSHLMPDWGPFWAHTNLQQHHLVLRGCSLHGKQGGGEGLFGEKPGAKLSCFDTTGASYRFKSPLKPSTGCQSSESALHLVVTSKNVPLPGVAFRMQAVRDPPGMEWCCSVLLYLEILQNCPGSGVWNHELNLTVPLFPLGLALLIELGLFHRSHIWNQEHELLQLRLTWTSTFPAVVSVGTSPKTNCPYKISTSWDKIFSAKLLLYFSDVQYNSDPALAPGPKTSSHFRSITYQRAVIDTGYSGHC